ncbi:Blue-light-activated histidine kinase 2 (plasmid) [Sulfitobacter indolifex]|uniref:histidine kinase n=1 Tax=Sulfitobacter indolifex HEL-45 TaxID=391624 RepID=A0ABM9X0X2_9RHOB|nr:cache domain-containing protein [Sulfitobacter indolifex]EDQ03102.1 signal transduction histidine kinase [Sulfitobacter indolifex HEL-45]UOA20513.1 Blue-light-activated histidine kinase 2 [Sulfitobacter indolifex]UOA20918.1 Blue-light-activated histidine kinase 2 [Sulfitobacter indolifex]
MVTKTIAGSVRVATIFIVATFLVYSSIVGALVYHGHSSAEDRAESSAAAAAKAVKINTGWIVEVARQALRRMDFALGSDVQSSQSATLVSIKDALEGLPDSAKAYIVTAEGQTLYTTDPNAPNIDIRDREYFAVPAGGQQFFTSSLLTSRIDGSPIFTFSQRLEREGAFVGVAIISFDAALLGELLASLGLGQGAALAILRADGMLVARYPPVDGPLDLSQHVIFKDHLPNADAGAYISTSPIDGEKRFVGYQTLPDSALIAIASGRYDETMARFWRRVQVFLAIVIPTILALAACAIWIIRLLRREAQKNEALETALEANTMLFREIHHRVKNNMQSMQALVAMHKLPKTVETNFKLRLAAMSTVHEHMYNHDKYAALDAPAFIASMTENIFKAHGASEHLSLDIDRISISHEQATSLAMLINEVVTNSLKYAGSDRDTAEIRIRLKLLGNNRANLVIVDNGPGFDPKTRPLGMGTKIIQGMALQLQGTYSYAFDGGTIFSLEFPVA